MFAICNTKQCFNLSKKLGNAAVQEDHKPEFLLLIAHWVNTWSKCPSLILTKKMSHALMTTLRGVANLINDLQSKIYDYILTSKFQSDPIEHHFSKYRQVSGTFPSLH